MKNGLDEQYIDLLKDILENGVEKNTRNGKVLSVFGRSIRYKFKDGKFPLLTTKKMAFQTMVTELIWFLRGDTNIKYLVDNGCNIWNGDAYKNYENAYYKGLAFGYKKLNDNEFSPDLKISKEEFINKIKTDDEFAEKWGELGPIYGKQWRKWTSASLEEQWGYGNIEGHPIGGKQYSKFNTNIHIDQIQNLINDLKTNPDSRRLMVNAWNIGELDQMVLPPCHYGFQVYTRELSLDERLDLMRKRTKDGTVDYDNRHHGFLDFHNIPKRAISLMWNQRSVDTFLGLPFNISSYGLLLEIIAKTVNMVPDELIGNLGDTHLYLNHIEQAKEQIGRELTLEERLELIKDNKDFLVKLSSYSSNEEVMRLCDEFLVPRRTREPFELPKLNINTEFWLTESGECGEGPLNAISIFNSFKDDNFCKCLLEEDIQLSNYQSHPTIKAPLSN